MDKILERAKNRQRFYEVLIKLVGVCLKRGLRLIIENPYSSLHYLHNNFFQEPSIIDPDRTMHGDYFKKPTGYWFFNCKNTMGFSYQKDKERRIVWRCRSAAEAGLCSEERSMISPDYARNFICDFILGKEQLIGERKLFKAKEENKNDK